MALNNVKKIDSVFIIPNTYKLVFKLKDSTNIYYLDCTDIFNSDYEKEIFKDVRKFSEINILGTKISWNNDSYDMCIDYMLENSEIIL